MYGFRTKKRYKVSVIDDEKELVDAIKQLLEPRDFSVSYAYGGRTGLEVIRSERPDVVILDINMPDMDGRDVLYAMKQDAAICDIPVIMLTARGEQLDKDYGLELGAQDYLVKPYDGLVLLRYLMKALCKG
jgi:DNA-binding response OmpR family regulator